MTGKLPKRVEGSIPSSKPEVLVRVWLVRAEDAYERSQRVVSLRE